MGCASPRQDPVQGKSFRHCEVRRYPERERLEIVDELSGLVEHRKTSWYQKHGGLVVDKIRRLSLTAILIERSESGEIYIANSHPNEENAKRKRSE